MYVGVKLIARIKEKMVTHWQFLMQPLIYSLWDFRWKRAKPILLCGEEDVGIALTVTLASFQLGHANF